MEPSVNPLRIAWRRRLPSIGLLLAFALPAVTEARTPTHTPTPITSAVGGIVLVFDTDSLAPAAGATIEGRVADIADENGNFSVVMLGVPPLLMTARVAGEPLRAMAFGNTVDITPFTEVSVRITEGIGLANFAANGFAEIVQAVELANADTDFAGLDLDDALVLAEATARASTNVMERIAANQTPTPTPRDTHTFRPTSTPSPTPTPRATGTPRPCAGDCDANGVVDVTDVLQMVTVVLGEAEPETCAVFAGSNEEPTVADLLQGVQSALHGCVPPAPAPDLVFTTIEPTTYVCFGMYLNVCIANVGQTDAPFIEVGIDSRRFTVSASSVPPGSERCLSRAHGGGRATLEIDPRNLVAEGNEANNLLVVDLPPGTPTCTPTP